MNMVRSRFPLITALSAALFLLCVSATASTQAAQQASPPTTASCRVGVYVQPPFVRRNVDGVYSGYAWDIWNEAAKRMGVKSEVREFETFADILEAVAAGTIDVAVTDMFMTSDRERRMEFTHPIADGGLRVMISTKRESRLGEVMRGLIEDGHARILLWGAVLLVGLAIPLAFFWRRIDPDFPKRPQDAFAEALYRLVSITMSGKTKVTSVSTWHTKILAAAWLVVGVGIVAYITSSVTSVMTKQALRGVVHSVDDLPGKTIGVVAQTVGESYAREHNIDAIPYPTLEAAVNALVAGHVTAVVEDSLGLEAYDHDHPELPITEVGAVFARRRYGLATPIASPIRHSLNIALVELGEAGTIDALYAKYFGN